jgi:hypothetical protein
VLNKWVDFLESRATIVLLKVSDDSNAYRMFETLNDRGLRVSQADLIKNYLYGRSADRLDEAQQKWTLVRGVLDNLEGDDTLIDFLRHSLIVTVGFVREAQLYDKVQKTAKSPQQVISFVNTLETLASLYVAIQNPEHENWNGYPATTRKAIEVLNLFGIKPFRPIMLAAAAKLPKKDLDLVFRLLVSLGVRLFIASSTRTGSVEQALSTSATKIYAGEIKTAAALKSALKDTIPTDTTFENAFRTARVSNGKLARYYLRSLEVEAEGDATPWMIPNDDQLVINLEHILPKNPIGNWSQFGTDEDAGAFTNRLGNQALLLAGENSKLGSEAFDTKKAVFAKSPYVLTSIVSNVTDWNATEIDLRQQNMAALAVKTWKI